MIKCAALLLAAACAQAAAHPEIDRVFNTLYDFQFVESQVRAQAYIAQHAEDPMGYAALAACWTFSEMNRLQTFSTEIFKDEKVSGAQAKRVGIDARRGFEDALNRAKNAGTEALKKNSKDTNALLALVIATGAERDFAALIEKRYKDSYYAARASQDYALQLQAVAPELADAWFTRGFSEYLVGSVSPVLRWLMKIERVEGSKRLGIEYMAKCAKDGQYLRPFAQMMLATIYKKDKRVQESRRMMQIYANEHPRNEMVRLELSRLPKS